MLKLSEDGGALITLTEQSTPKGDGLFWFASALLVGAVGVAMAMSLLPERLAISALALLIVGSFIFNKLRQQKKRSRLAHINSGKLEVSAGCFVHQNHAVQNRMVLDTDDNIEVSGTQLTIKDGQGQQKCCVSGFESEKEAQVMQAVLQGQKFGKRHANIKMQSS